MEKKFLILWQKKRNEDYFLEKGDTTYIILQPYQDFLSSQDLVPNVTFPYKFQPVSNKLGSYGNASFADTVRYSFKLDDKDSDYRVYPNITKF